jgi:hypothetical protein
VSTFGCFAGKVCWKAKDADELFTIKYYRLSCLRCWAA